MSYSLRSFALFLSGDLSVEAGADGPVEVLAGAAAVGNLPVEFLDTTHPVFAEADLPVEALAGAAAVADAPVEWRSAVIAGVGDFPVEALGRDPFELTLLWVEFRLLDAPLVLSWLEVPRELGNADLPITWVERETVTAALVLTWLELPATLQDLAEADIQRPFGRITRTP